MKQLGVRPVSSASVAPSPTYRSQVMVTCTLAAGWVEVMVKKLEEPGVHVVKHDRSCQPQ
jgi:hypothetical protein